MKSDDSLRLREALIDLLLAGKANSQDELRLHLAELGFETNQSKISRMLRQIGAVKSKNEQGATVYRLQREPAPPTTETPMSHLVLGVVFNQHHIIVKTSPGAAPLIARVLDHQDKVIDILGTLAGDDSVLVIPSDVTQTEEIAVSIKRLLMAEG
jgi:transcriptional regulator of arginine metabolism